MQIENDLPILRRRDCVQKEISVNENKDIGIT